MYGRGMSLARLLVLAALALIAAPVVESLEATAHADRARARHRAAPKATPKHRKRKPPASSALRSDNMPPGWSWPPTRAMVAAGKACTAELDALGITWKRGTATRKIATPIMVPGMELGGIKLVSRWRQGPFVMDCALALELARHGEALHAIGVRELQFSRIHGYTKVRVGGRTKNMLSRHALGLAMDIYSIKDDQGRVAVVETDYPQGDPLLLAVEQALNGAGGFRTVLTPRNDPRSHHDHFHIEARVDLRPPRPSS